MHFFLLVAAALLFAVSLAPYVDIKGNKYAELASHFPLQYAVAALVFLLAAFALGTYGVTFVLLLLALGLNLCQIAPFVSFARQQVPMGEGQPLKLLQVNVLKLNTDTNHLRRIIEEEQPDIIAASEVTPAFAAMLAGFEALYPYRLVEPEEKSSFGMALLSRLPFSQIESVSFDGPKNRAMVARVRLDGHDIDIISIHPTTPNVKMASRDAEFDNIAKRVGANSTNLVLLGDFNATPYCPAYKKLTRALKLKNAREGLGIMGSFPQYLPTPFLKLPIDHVLLGTNLRALTCRLGSVTGSDHLPLLVTITYVTD